MADKNTREQVRGWLWALPDRWSVVALLIAAVVVAPMIAVLWLATHPTENIWPHLLSTVLPRYVRNTLLLMFGVGVLAAAVGTGAAWPMNWACRRMRYRVPLAPHGW